MTKAPYRRKSLFGFRVPERQEPIMWEEGWQQAADIVIGTENYEFTSCTISIKQREQTRSLWGFCLSKPAPNNVLSHLPSRLHRLSLPKQCLQLGSPECSTARDSGRHFPYKPPQIPWALSQLKASTCPLFHVDRALETILCQHWRLACSSPSDNDGDWVMTFVPQFFLPELISLYWEKFSLHSSQ